MAGESTERVRRMDQGMDSSDLQHWLTEIENFKHDSFLKSEKMLHRASHGPTWMSDARVADKVADNLHRLDGEAYRLFAFSIMSNHVHTVFKPFLGIGNLREVFDETNGLIFDSDYPGLARIMQSLKGRSARECNLILERSGPILEHESFDHVIRRGKFDKTIRYVLNNPVKAGIVDHWEIGDGTTARVN